MAAPARSAGYCRILRDKALQAQRRSFGSRQEFVLALHASRKNQDGLLDQPKRAHAQRDR